MMTERNIKIILNFNKQKKILIIGSSIKIMILKKLKIILKRIKYTQLL